MSKPTSQTTSQKASPLMVRLDSESKQALTDAAELRRISVSDYVRTVTVAQAQRRLPVPVTRQFCSAATSNSLSGNLCKPHRNSRQPRNGWEQSCGARSERVGLASGVLARTASPKSPARLFDCGQSEVNDWLHTKSRCSIKTSDSPPRKCFSIETSRSLASTRWRRVRWILVTCPPSRAKTAAASAACCNPRMAGSERELSGPEAG